MAQPLFRKEVLDRLGERGHGNILLATPFAYKVIVGFFCLFAICLILFFFNFSYARKAVAVGVIMPSGGTVRVVAPATGTIKNIYVQQGAKVKVGDPLFLISDERYNINSGNTSENIEKSLITRKRSLETETADIQRQTEQKKQALFAKKKQLTTEIEGLLNQEKIALNRLTLTLNALTQNEQLEMQGFISKAQIDAKKAEHLESQSRLFEIRRLIENARSELDIASLSLSEQTIQSSREIANHERAVSAANRDVLEIQSRNSTLVRSPVDGVFGSSAVRLGQSINQGAFVVFINSNSAQSPSEMIADIALPSASIGFVKVGTPVKMRYSAFPYQKFGQYSAVISEISPTMVLPADNSNGTGFLGKQNEPYFPAKAKLERQDVQVFGQSQALIPGLTFDAVLILESRTLVEWITEPLRSLSPKND